MGPGQKLLTRVRSIFCCSGRFGLVWVWFWKISLKKYQIFNFLPFGSIKISSGWVKGRSTSYLLRVKSMLGSGQGQSLTQGQFCWCHLWLGFGFGKFPLKIPIFSIFLASGQKKSLRVRSKSGGVKGRLTSHLQLVKSNACAGLGQGPSLLQIGFIDKYLKDFKS